jgi:glycosyltransferase involved in cell wall biosynthesis
MRPPNDAPALRIAVDAVHGKTGGGLTYLRAMLPRLAARPDLDVHLYAGAETLRLLAPFDGRIVVHEVAPWQGRIAEALWEQLRLPPILRADRIDVTFAPANFAPLAAPRPVVLLRNALGVAARERRPAMMAYWAMLALATWASLLRCRRTIAVSDYARRTIAGPLRARTTVVPHGVAETFAPGPDARESFLLAVADIYPQKNLHGLIAAFAILVAHRRELQLIIAGRRVDETYAADLERLISTHRLTSRVRFAGVLEPEALASLYRRCAAFVFPSTMETFGNPLLEAMASGAPIASSRAAAMPEILGDAGVYFDPDEPADIARAVAQLLDDPDLRVKLGLQGVARARVFSWDATAARTAAILREVGGHRVDGR